MSSLSLEIDCLWPGGRGNDWKMPKSKVGREFCSGDAERGSVDTIDGGKTSGGNGFISLSPVFGRRFGLFLVLDERLVGALDPDSESVDVLEPVVLDPVLEMVFVLPLDA